VERRRKDLGLPLPWLPVLAHRRSPPRAGREAAPAGESPGVARDEVEGSLTAGREEALSDSSFALKDCREVAEGTTAFWFDTSGADFAFEAGQNADFTLVDPPKTDAEGNTRTFSFASSPDHRDSFMIATRMRPTAFKDSLRSLPPGTAVRVTGPNGNMLLHEDADRPAVFLAGGIGITPFRAMLEWATERRLSHRIDLFYSNRTPAATAFLQDLEGWASRNPNLRIFPTVTQSKDAGWRYETGRIDEAMLRRHVSDLSRPIYYLAGPPSAVMGLRKLLLDQGVRRDAIRLESFSGY
jgi:ferredoxin-NADP reductase